MACRDMMNLFLESLFQYSIFYEDGSDESEATNSGVGSNIVPVEIGQDTPAALLVKAAEAEARNSANAGDEQALNASLVAQEVGSQRFQPGVVINISLVLETKLFNMLDKS